MNAFPSLTFIDPVQMLPVPFSNRLVVLEKAGRLVVFENRATATTKTVLFDIRSRVESSHDSGMMGVVFHPDFGKPDSPNRHYLYVYYRYTPQKSDSNRAYCRLSRFTWDPASNAIATSSEFVLINQYDRHNWHNGGGLLFGPDGFLYLSIGDEGGANDQYNSGQRMDLGLLAGVLRLDVDRDPSRSHPIRRQPLSPAVPPSGWPATYSQGYYIPNDNPWQSANGSQLEEFYAIGLRSPHRMTQDPVTGDIWVGDVGQGTQEEVSRVVRGGNLQWPYREGNVTGPKSKPASLIGFDVPPVLAYGRSTGTCVIGGYVYRGALHPELVGKYLFGDHGSGRIWSLDASGSSPVVTQLTTLTSHGPGPKRGMGSFGIDASGEVYVLSLAGTDLDGGIVYRLEKSTQGVPEPPQLLSQTTAFSNLADLSPAAGVMPYDVIQPLWSDGADKNRWIAIPNDGTPNTAAERIVWSEEGHWSFPAGTVLIKHFEYPGRRLETRFFVRGDDGDWFGFTYRWREDGSDAELLPGEPLDETFTLDGEERTWRFPGRSECSACHTDAAGKVLGVKTRQLNRDFYYEQTGRTANQLVTLNRLGFFSPAIDESRLASALVARRQDDPTASLERRARSYLDVNCSHCHQPAAPTQAAFDARLETPPFYQNLINVTPGNPLGIVGSALVSPGRPDLSVIHRRAGSTAEGIAMPPIAKNLVDEAGMSLLTDWINSLDPATVPSGPATGTPPSDHGAPILTLTKTDGGGAEVSGPFSATLTASEPIVGLTVADFAAVNATISSLAGSGTNWTFTVSPTGAGSGSVSIGSDRVTDVNGNANTANTGALAFVTIEPTDPGNLLTDGGFESGLDGWDRGANVAVSSSAYRGLQSVTVGASTWLVQTIPVAGGANHLYSGWVRAVTAGVRAEAGLSFWDSQGNWVGDRVLPLAPGAAWESFELAFTAPTSAVHVSVWILTEASGGVAVDDLAIRAGGPGDPPAGLTNLLENGGFEAGLAPWDRGGTVTVSDNARTGAGAAKLEAGSFLVVTRAALPGESFELSGGYFTEGAAGLFEVGFSFWDASGDWITDRSVVLGEVANYADFLVPAIVPENAATMTVWLWRASGGAATVDDLVLVRTEGGIDLENLLTNGGFENGGLASWDIGGTDVSVTTEVRSGSAAALVGADAFIVHNRAATAGERYRFSGYARTSGSGERQAGFSFWGSGGQWLGDTVVNLPVAGDYLAFAVESEVPVGALSCSVWVWSGSGGSIAVDDLSLERLAESGATESISGFEAEFSGEMTQMALKSGRSFDLSVGEALGESRLIARSLGYGGTVYTDAWEPASGGGAVAQGLPPGAPKRLVTSVDGSGLLSTRWKLVAPGGSASLVLFVDGRERGRLDGGGKWETFAATIVGPGRHTVEFRLVPGSGETEALQSVSASLDRLRFFPGRPVLQPDLAIGRKGGGLVGRGIFHPNGNRQVASIKARRTGTAFYRMRWWNRSSGPDDGALLVARRAQRSHRVSYFQLGEGRRNLTASILAGTHATERVPRGAGELFEIAVKRTSRSRTSRFAGTLRAHSQIDPGKADGVRFRVR